MRPQEGTGLAYGYLGEAITKLRALGGGHLEKACHVPHHFRGVDVMKDEPSLAGAGEHLPAQIGGPGEDRVPAGDPVPLVFRVPQAILDLEGLAFTAPAEPLQVLFDPGEVLGMHDGLDPARSKPAHVPGQCC